MSQFLKDKAAIAGIGLTEFSKKSGVSELSLAAQATLAACEDAGLPPSEIDGFVSYTLDSTDEIELARTVGAGDLKLFTKVNYGGGAAVGTILHAVMAVATGVADNVVCYRAMNGRSGQRMGQGISGQIVSSDLVHWSWYMPYGMLTPGSWIAMIANKYMHHYGVTAEDLGRVAISQRNYAQSNPRSFFHGKPLTMEDYLASKMIADPLRLYDFCQETDGGCAILVTSAERARDLQQKPAIIRGVVQASTRGQEQMTSYYREELDSLPEMEMAARLVYAQSGLGPDDINAACLYDAFTSEVIMQLESFGFCGRGEGKDMVRDGALDIDGRLPNNTHGGLLSEAYIHGMNSIAEGARLVRGTSTSQPKGVEHVLVSSGVGVPTGALILGRD
ncbi:MAG TPA: lipid-transfer protein [Halieaceae bacterium]|jgi:acetyl-CoA acetyltransferase|nr:lipid-transfer protein [Haliea sp.]HBM85067.1 lipid-transfer protein [Halieaceae bacterium]MAD63302.1 lipid-transfer protein [Haliea sp.]MAY94234.1 lipid-transfer protein [Haliea sp.]MBK40021.1 lipid-transfer protein [Haliea sp.]MBP70148.1 lipid-transfer protein [Haliea sp.]|tara:strand:+ start:1654 stop:2823 length:1170 start_codon:yes stop_codon:yes gene_type:complete